MNTEQQKKMDLVNQPPHYKSHPSGIECIRITEHFNFNRGNAIKYIWRAGEKNSEIQDLKKAAWYINREIERMEYCPLSDPSHPHGIRFREDSPTPTNPNEL
jgi:hypothetical protein